MPRPAALQIDSREVTSCPHGGCRPRSRMPLRRGAAPAMAMACRPPCDRCLCYPGGRYPPGFNCFTISRFLSIDASNLSNAFGLMLTGLLEPPLTASNSSAVSSRIAAVVISFRLCIAVRPIAAGAGCMAKPSHDHCEPGHTNFAPWPKCRGQTTRAKASACALSVGLPGPGEVDLHAVQMRPLVQHATRKLRSIRGGIGGGGLGAIEGMVKGVDAGAGDSCRQC